MDPAPILAVPGFSEPFSSCSHLLAAGAGLAGFAFLYGRGRGNALRVASLAVFTFSLVFLFSMSGVYHLLQPGSTSRIVFERLDHAAIWVLVAGTFTPIHVILFRGFWRWGILLLVWTIAITGLVLKTVFFMGIPGWLGLAFYLGLGWMGVLSAWRLIKIYGRGSVELLFWGGVAYSVGALLNIAGWPTLIPGVIGPHELFHVFVLVGAGLHWTFIHKWAVHPVLDDLVFEVRERSDSDYFAKAVGESIAVQAASREGLRLAIKEKIRARFHARMPPTSISLLFVKEEVWSGFPPAA